MRSVAALLAAAVLAGCATTQDGSEASLPAEQADAIAAEAKQKRVNRELTQAWDNMGRGGAALRQPAYVHVLGEPEYFLEESTEGGSVLNEGETRGVLDKNALEVALTAFTDIQKGRGYSHYELSRWERYCDAGKGMDEKDWRFIEAEGAKNVPSSLIGKCSPPDHNYQAYLAAWTRFCTSESPTEADRQIVRSSVRPVSVVNPCDAIK